jgi:hypothetical protein
LQPRLSREFSAKCAEDDASVSRAFTWSRRLFQLAGAPDENLQAFDFPKQSQYDWVMTILLLNLVQALPGERREAAP